MSYNPAERGATVLTQIGTPASQPPSTAPTPGDTLIQTADGTANSGVQATWEYTTDGKWVQIGASVVGSNPPTPGVRNYYQNNQVIQSLWSTAAQISAASIAAYGFAAVGAGAAIAPFGPVYGRQFIAMDAAAAINGTGPATDADYLVPPTKYIRHELQAAAGTDNTYFLNVAADRASAVEVWVCNVATGAPELRLSAQAVSSIIAGRRVALSPSPLGEVGSDNAGLEWLPFTIPKAALAGRLTGIGTVKLAIRPAMFNQEGARLYIGGYAMSSGSVGLTTRSVHAIDKRVDGGGFIAYSGYLDGLGYSAVAAGVQPTIANGNVIRIALIDTTRDIWLSLVGHGNANGNPSQWLETKLVHTSGDVTLGRPRPQLASPMATAHYGDIGNGHPLSGWVVPAATLAAKSIKPANSAVSYLELQFKNVDQSGQLAYYSGIITETLA